MLRNLHGIEELQVLENILKMPQEFSIDIDTPFDWEIAEYLMSKSINPYENYL